MNILILSGSPRKGGNTELLAEAFAKGAADHHHVEILSVHATSPTTIVPTFADVDKEYQYALNNGAKSVLPPTTEPWGQRTCYVADPDGNLIEIGSFVE